MDSKNIMHVKLEFEEAREIKKEILSLEIEILHMLNIIHKYRELRMAELKNKQSINLKFKKLGANIVKMKKIIPKVQIPEKYNKEKKEVKMPEKKIAKEKARTDIEFQLQEIQKRLDSLDQKF